MDENGSLSLAELKAILQREGGGASMQDEEVEELLAYFDSGGDDALQLDEFLNAMAALDPEYVAKITSE